MSFVWVYEFSSRYLNNFFKLLVLGIKPLTLRLSTAKRLQSNVDKKEECLLYLIVNLCLWPGLKMHTLGLKECKNCLKGKDLCQFRKIVLILGFRYKSKRFFKARALKNLQLKRALQWSSVVAAERILVSWELPASFPTFLSPHYRCFIVIS